MAEQPETPMVRVSYRIPETLARDLNHYAVQDDRPESRLVREALGAYIRQRKARKK